MQQSNGNLHGAADAAAVSITTMEYSIGRIARSMERWVFLAALAAIYLLLLSG